VTKGVKIMSFGWLFLINMLIGFAMNIAFIIITDDLAKRKFGEEIVQESDDDVHQRVVDGCMNSEKAYKIVMSISIMLISCAWEVLIPITTYVTWRDYKELYNLHKGS
jgi:hypothetical protein